MAYKSIFADTDPTPAASTTKPKIPTKKKGYVSIFADAPVAPEAPVAPVQQPVEPPPVALGPQKNVLLGPMSSSTVMGPAKLPAASANSTTALPPMQSGKSLKNLGERTFASVASGITKTAKFGTDLVAKRPSVVISAMNPSFGTLLQSTPAGKFLDDKSASAYKKLTDANLNPIVESDKGISAYRESVSQTRPEWENASVTEKVTKYLPETLYNLVPDVIGSLAPYLVNPAAGMAISLGSTAEDVKQKAIDSGVDVKRAEEIGLVTGLAVSLIDRIVPNKVLAPAAKDKFVKGLFKRFASSKIGAALGEASTEATQEAIQIAAEKTFREDLGWDEIKTREAMSAFGGLFGGTGLHAVASIAQRSNYDGETSAPEGAQPPVPPVPPAAPAVPFDPAQTAPPAPAPTVPPAPQAKGYTSIFADKEPAKPKIKPAVKQAQNPVAEMQQPTEPTTDAPSEIDAFAKFSQEQTAGRYFEDEAARGRKLKGDAMELATIKRGLEGKPTSIELRKAKDYLTSNYAGKEVDVNGQKGTVTKTSFGRIGVRLPDGTEQFFDPSEISSRGVNEKMALDHIKAEAERKFDQKKALSSGFSYAETPAQTAPINLPTPVSEAPELPAMPEKKPIELKDNELHNRVMNELVNAEAGKRLAVENEDTSGYTFSAQRSTFPSWIPEDLRKKPLLTSVANHIEKGTVPKGAAERRLYDIVAEEMDAQESVLNDSKFVEQERKNLYNPFASDAENAAALAKFDAEYAKLKAGKSGITETGGGTVQGVGAEVQGEDASVRQAPAETVAPESPATAEKKMTAEEFVAKKTTKFRSSKAEDYADKKKLFSVHNTTGNKLLFADKMGGMANPSLAVVDLSKGDFAEFGDITLIANPDLVRKGKTFQRDVYSPRHPTSSYELDYKQKNDLFAALKPFEAVTGDESSQLDSSDIERSVRYSPLMRAKFLSDRNIELPQKAADQTPRRYGYDLQEKIESLGLANEYDDAVDAVFEGIGAKPVLFSHRTYSGTKKFLPATAENASKIMNKEALKGGESFFYGAGNIAAKLSPELKSLEAIRKASNKIISQQEFETIKTNVNNELLDLGAEADVNTEALADYLAGTDRGWLRSNSDLPPEMWKKLDDFKYKLKHLETGYFETKFKRPVALNEFSKAIIPDNASPRVIELLKRKGIEYETYKAGDNADRTAKILANRDSLAFRLKDDLAKRGIKINDGQEAEIIALNKRYFGDSDVRLVAQIIENSAALGKYENGIIEIMAGQADPTDTFMHESVHKYLDAFTTRDEYVDLLKAGQEKYGTDDFVQVEESIAEDFIGYAKSRSGVVGKIKGFFDTIIDRINVYLKNKKTIESLYRDILSGKAKEAGPAKERARPASPASKASNEKASRVYERLQAEDQSLTDDVKYKEINMRSDAEKAVKLVADDKQRAYRIAMGAEDAPDGQTATSINIALAEQAREEGNSDLYARLTVQRSLEQTRRGQEINAEKGSVTDNSTARYVKDLIQLRLDKLGSTNNLEKLGVKQLKKGPGETKKSKTALGVEKIDNEVKKIKEGIKSAKELDIQEAQSFLDSLACK